MAPFFLVADAPGQTAQGDLEQAVKVEQENDNDSEIEREGLVRDVLMRAVEGVGLAKASLMMKKAFILLVAQHTIVKLILCLDILLRLEDAHLAADFSHGRDKATGFRRSGRRIGIGLGYLVVVGKRIETVGLSAVEDLAVMLDNKVAVVRIVDTKGKETDAD